MTPLRLALAGAGLIGKRHAELIRDSAECALCAIVDPSPGAVGYASEHGVPRYETLSELFGATRPDGVIIATPNALHVENALDCVGRGVPALIEKPVADAVADGERLIDAAARSGVPLLVGHHRRHSPLLAKAREIVQSGALGPLVAVTGSAMFYKPDTYFDDGPWRKQAGGGPILINMIHEVDNLRSICGEIVGVQALVSNVTRGFTVEDTAAIGLSFASGALGTFLLSDTAASARSWEQTSGENPSYAHYGDEDCYLFAGTQGSLAFPTMRLKTYAGERSWWTPFATDVVAVERADPLVRQLAHFCAVIRREATPLCSVSDGVASLRVTQAISDAARIGRAVSLQ
jgi:predicted dehydrogenase